MDWENLIVLWLAMSVVASIVMATGMLAIKLTDAKYRHWRIPFMAGIIAFAPIALPLIITLIIINNIRHGNASFKIGS